MNELLNWAAHGLLDLPWWSLVLITLALTHITIASVTIYLHRHQAHRALDLHPAVAHFFRFWLWLTTGMVTREWVAIHRRHHAKCETADDPHSPAVLGIHTVLWTGAELYRGAVGERERLAQYDHGTPKDWMERHLYGRYNFHGVSLMLILDVALFGAAGLTVWAVQMLWIPFFAAGVINGLGHWWGYRNFESRDRSTNLLPWGILIGGEELHNNHHAYAASARLSAKWYEFDIGWFYIRSLELLGLARVKKLAPRPVRGAQRPEIDLEAVRALVVARLHVMADYSGRVLLPVLREEQARADRRLRALFGQARQLLDRDTQLLDADSQGVVQRALEASQRLATVHQFRQHLAALWSQRASSQEQLVAAVQDWCRQAEATGIEALAEFARSLRGYALRPA